MQTKKTDNHFLADKIALRYWHLPHKPRVHVLDCFGGRGLVWDGVQQRTDKEIVRLPIDIRGDIGFHLPGDNMKYLYTINVGDFDVIDLDAYGVPFAQLAALFERGYQGTVFVTFIQTLMGAMPNALLYQVGFTPEMIKKCPTLFYKRGWDYFKSYLARNGVREIWHRSKQRKHYLGFRLD